MTAPLHLKVEIEPIEEMARRYVEPFYRFRFTATDSRQTYQDEVIVSETDLLSRFDALFKMAHAGIGAMIRRERGDGIITPAPGVRWTLPEKGGEPG